MLKLSGLYEFCIVLKNTNLCKNDYETKNIKWQIEKTYPIHPDQLRPANCWTTLKCFSVLFDCQDKIQSLERHSLSSKWYLNWEEQIAVWKKSFFRFLRCKKTNHRFSFCVSDSTMIRTFEHSCLTQRFIELILDLAHFLLRILIELLSSKSYLVLIFKEAQIISGGNPIKISI